jgi:glutamate formiminotransferase/glutamate formiminotransferase/formiminotetrahydrofolate cyclodeaminase
MNLTNYEETPIHVAFEAVRREAAQHQVQIAGSEVIGLVPQQALIQAAVGFLKLDGFDPSQVLEARMESVLVRMLQARSGASGRQNEAASSLRSFLEALSASSPMPAGGSVAALAGALAAALGVMACRIGSPAKLPPSIGSGAMEGADDLHATEQRLIELRRRLEELVQADAEAYGQFLQAARLPKTDPAREDAIVQGLGGAIGVSLEIADLACEAAALLRLLPARTRPSVGADLKVGLMMALAAAEGGLINAEENEKTALNHRVISIFANRISALKERLVDLRKL